MLLVLGPPSKRTWFRCVLKEGLGKNLNFEAVRSVSAASLAACRDNIVGYEFRASLSKYSIDIEEPCALSKDGNATNEHARMATLRALRVFKLILVEYILERYFIAWHLSFVIFNNDPAIGHSHAHN
jgi:hypothetical protein